LAIKAFSGAVTNNPTPDINLNNVQNGDILVYDSSIKAFNNSSGSFTTLSQVNTLIANIASGGSVDLSAYATTSALATQATTTNNALALKANITYVDAQIAAIVHPATDLTNYITTSTLTSALTNYDTSANVTSKINTAIANATIFDGNYANLTNTPVIPDLTGYATQTWTQTQISNHIIDLSAYITSAAHTTSITNFVTESVIDTKIATAVGGGVDLSDYALTTAVTSAVAVESTRALNAEASLNVKVTANETDIISNTNAITSEAITARNAEAANAAAIVALQNNPVVGNIADLLDVDTTTPSAGQVLKYNGSSWGPATDATSGGGGLDADTLDGQDSTYFLNYSNLTNAPTIPTDINDLTDTSNLLVGFSGAYADLTGKPILFSGAYTDLTGKPTIPVDVSDLTDTGSLLGSGGGVTDYNNLTNLPTIPSITGLALTSYVDTQIANVVGGGSINLSSYATLAYVDQKLIERGMHFSGDYNDLTNLPALFSGSYPDLTNKPTTAAGYGITDMPDSILDLSIADGLAGQVLTTDGSGSFSFTSAGAFNGDYNSLVNRPDLFSGDYVDLANKPYIPSIAGLASTIYVDAKHAEANIFGNKYFQNNVSQVTKVSNIVAASHDQFVMSITTTDATPTEALLASGQRLLIEDNSTVMYKVHIVGADGTDHFGVRVQGIIDQTSGTIALIGSPSTEVLVDTTNVWTGSVTSDVANTSLKILVTGEASKTVKWTIFVEQNVIKR
tara:strand:- start:2057 stop:4273 length:2217 start_codon:yes stop_codon:yes gene_type:complete